MLAYRTTDGKLLWKTTVPSTGVEHIYQKNSHASATPTTDGQRIYASFGTHGLAAFDFSGKLVWHQKLGDLNNYHGSAGSPVLYKDRLFLFQDHGGTAIWLVRRRVQRHRRARSSGRRSGQLAWAGARPSSSMPAITTSSSSAASGACSRTIRTPAPSCGRFAATRAR